eukprot:TRINITY_DN41856_c0_g1_i1.p1 TRINITY_DN41856_c0_g1~~TRINITY_DN41856_c0_g1_i1.p1  ORF type:complete len:167 (-),score=6.18 TRINITY_DN41856_c0_g1_i1:94-594(-)
MIENNKWTLEANSKSDLFYSKWKRDTSQSVFFAAPVAVVICLVCFTLIVGVSVKLIFILLLPLSAIITSLVYSTLFLRKKYINGMIKKIHLENYVIQIETYGWFNYKPLYGSFSVNDIHISSHSDNAFFKGKHLWILNGKGMETTNLYMIEDFFDSNLHSLIKEIN